MKVAYIAGPYRSKSEYGVSQNIKQASRVALKYWQLGYAVICPHKNTAFFGGALGLPDSIWIKGDLEILSRCDLIVMLPNWRQSVGACEELEYAKKLGIEVRYE